MKNVIIPIILSLVVSGCTTMGSVNKNFSRINSEDGISKKEAKLIAKKALMDSKFKGRFRMVRPEIFTDKYTKRHPNHWFLKAKSKRLVVGIDKFKFLVVIDKRNGEVVYADKNDYYPTDIKGYGWIMTLHEQKIKKG